MTEELTTEQKLKLLVANRPWETEPNNAEWMDEDTKYKCRIKRNPSTLSLCGYVGVPKSHPCWGRKYDDMYDSIEDLSVHGGLTYSDGDDDGWWWLGFDCAHSGDLSPSVLLHFVSIGYDALIRDEEYRTWEFVEREVRELSRQLRLIENQENDMVRNV